MTDKAVPVLICSPLGRQVKNKTCCCEGSIFMSFSITMGQPYSNIQIILELISVRYNLIPFNKMLVTG